ncbi:helix-turn-helix domain-containing protein, partial [Nonomuraea sp. NN258]|uniref:PucR family transcriptional regulator n=1 Tax=Nonomuraea antri TaxID=2730852 RepID=UPI0015687E4A
GGAAGESGGRVLASLALSGPDEHVIVQPLGGGGPRPRGFFAVGSGQPFSPVTHTVINAAGSLLTLALEQGNAQSESVRRVRTAVLELLLAGAEEQAREVLAPLGARLPDPPLVVLAAHAEALETLEPHTFTARLRERRPAEGARPDEPARADADDGVVVALVSERPTEKTATAVPEGRAEKTATAVSEGPAEKVVAGFEGRAEKVAAEVSGPVGLSSPCDYGDLRGGLDQARRALDSSRGGTVRFGELAGQGLLALLDPAAARAFAAALLAPLTGYGSRADLVESLRAYLDSNGHWDAAAQRLGIHRHTLRYRMKRVSELLARDLDDPGVRAELWLALEASGRQPQS